MTIDELISSYTTKDEFFLAVEREILTLAINNPEFSYMNPIYTGMIDPSYIGPAITKKSKQLAGPMCSGCIFGQALSKLGVSPKELRTNLDIKSIIPCCPENWVFCQKMNDKGVTWRKIANNLHRKY